MAACNGRHSPSFEWRRGPRRSSGSTRSRTPTCGRSYPATVELSSENKASADDFFRQLTRSPDKGEAERRRPRPRSACQVSRPSNSPVAVELHTQFGIFFARTHQQRKPKTSLRPQGPQKTEYVGLSYKLRLNDSRRRTQQGEPRSFRKGGTRETLACPPFFLQTQEGKAKRGLDFCISKALHQSLGEVLTISPAKLKLRPSGK